MKSNYKSYEFEKSLDRIDAILDSGSLFEDKDTIPKREDLTYTNGYYVNCSSLFIDLRGSSQLPKIHQKRVLAKIYRAYISEMVAIINGSTLCKEINIVGDCVSAIFETPYKADINEVFTVAFKMNTLINILNYKLEKKGYKPIKAGIGLAYGRVLMIKAGYNGSGINDVVWMGDAVNQASKMCGKANKDVSYPIVSTELFYSNLNEHNQGLMTRHLLEGYYYGSVIHVDMDKWLTDAKEKDAAKNKTIW
ncbi:MULTISPECIES: adenylate/guanylate cyclase domain-containing protein [Bacillus cereus group]|uniref:adenylate/guanylate cyclase domain-containing protein n=1 Tax=Bacillus cereus group TaxID=86661 RepID=UPI001E31AFBF|nr:MULTISPECIES: adenylate/guanylate cyclase domain-containing protein [Bacillus cereus group]MCC2414302.1 adenylate/guanylate cyclase domain-containing protein [Bacillus paranthracis]MDX5923202.1 adenylate/guanylate cyclase domain-containing protein [Bacillus cereus group sp. BfR-BA-01033]MDX5975778.1 adenylate/guanylate cyclase domain-containing protein [Bacillus cereus group sp. BfR-BA-00287]